MSNGLMPEQLYGKLECDSKHGEVESVSSEVDVLRFGISLSKLS